VERAYRNLTTGMRLLVADKRRLGRREEHATDILSQLVKANDGDDKLQLTEQELLSNIFVTMIAGQGVHHRSCTCVKVADERTETTAHTLAATLALLALHPDEQELVYTEIQAELGDASAPVNLFLHWACQGDHH
jgi:cytochrome P450